MERAVRGDMVEAQDDGGGSQIPFHRTFSVDRAIRRGRTATLFLVHDHPWCETDCAARSPKLPTHGPRGGIEWRRGLGMALRLDPGVVLMDLRMQGSNGVNAIARFVATGRAGSD